MGARTCRSGKTRRIPNGICHRRGPADARPAPIAWLQDANPREPLPFRHGRRSHGAAQSEGFAYRCPGTRLKVRIPSGPRFDRGRCLTPRQPASPTLAILTALHHVTAYRYDELNRLTESVYPDHSFQQFTYDAAGNRQSMVEASGTTAYSYDEADRLTQLTPPTVSADTYPWDANVNSTGRSDRTT